MADTSGEPVATIGPVTLDAATADAVEAGVEPQQVPLTRRVVPQGESAGASILDRLVGLTVTEQLRVVMDLVRESTAAVLGHRESDAFDEGQAFKNLGFDSLSAVRLRNRLQDFTGVSLASTLVFDYPTPAILAAHLRDELLGERPELPAATARATLSDEPIAIVAMSTRLPGGVDTPEELWNLVLERRDAIAGFPVDRGWDLDGLYDPDPPTRARATPDRVGSCTTPRSSTAGCSGSRRGRRWRWIHSSGCCWRPPGRRWSGPASTRCRCGAVTSASSPESSTTTT